MDALEGYHFHVSEILHVQAAAEAFAVLYPALAAEAGADVVIPDSVALSPENLSASSTIYPQRITAAESGERDGKASHRAQGRFHHLRNRCQTKGQNACLRTTYKTSNDTIFGRPSPASCSAPLLLNTNAPPWPRGQPVPEPLHQRAHAIEAGLKPESPPRFGRGECTRKPSPRYSYLHFHTTKQHHNARRQHNTKPSESQLRAHSRQ